LSGDGTLYDWSYAFTGRPIDSATALYDYRRRPYDSGFGRFLVEDPIGYRGRYSLYEYVRSNPLALIDPLGLQTSSPGTAGLDPNCPDVCGPDVTKWFLKDLREIAARLSAARRTLSDDAYAEYFRLTVKYALAYKWMPFPAQGCATNNCRGTVMFAGVCIRKNQLGNIAFGYISANTGIGSERFTIGYAYQHIPSVGAYANGTARADNLAAFSLGANVAGIPYQQGFSAGELGGAIEGQFTIDPTRTDLFSRYGDLFGNGTKLNIGNLTFIPEFNGFNTQSCKPCNKVYNGPSSLGALTQMVPFWTRMRDADLEKLLPSSPDYYAE